MKVIAFYLPQFHPIPENDKLWGTGFTEWTNVKKAKKYKDDQYQPREPLNDNYYDLRDISVIRWQTELAKEYGIYGFCIYHYWFNGKLLLEKPLEMMLEAKDIKFPYCICWANENWTNQWKANTNYEVFFEQKYGNRNDWENHFEYLYQFFIDDRYIKINGKPLLVIYRPDIIENIDEMLYFWNEKAKEYGLKGLCFAYQKVDEAFFNFENGKDKMFDYHIEYQPSSVMNWAQSKKMKKIVEIKRKVFRWLGEHLDTNVFTTIIVKTGGMARDYDKDWTAILKHEPKSRKDVPCAFVDWDNTPRRGRRGIYYKNVSCKSFGAYFKELIKKAEKQYAKDFLFVFAWNEWAEGGYLEPDKKNRYGYLEAIKEALVNADSIFENY
ncbi:glycoside hydrolase family 99-like domain-containing protein [Butyrivibrio hungatei]|uniref:glycosyltransferase WbsX family protein n=1 Tax=Butyrivibrio hungatei TaxID=185008 RepID=UPI00041696A4|nr:glycoside hydrolase family 99-like domain-containing protein [Butyrivibrio hungatei]